MRKLLSKLFRSADDTKTPAVSTRRGEPLVSVSATQPMAIATVYRCVRLLSESVAALPMQYMRMNGGIYVPYNGDRLNYLLNVQPNPYMSAFDMWRTAVAMLYLHGNAYIVPVVKRTAPEIDALFLCSPHSVTHDTCADTYCVYDGVNGINDTFDESQIIHIKGMPGKDPKTGIGVIAYARQTLDIAATGDSETRNRFANGGNVRGIVTNDRSVRGFGEYEDEALRSIAAQMDLKFHDGDRIVSVPGDIDFKQISLSSTDMQFLESRKFTVREICRFFGVHPSYVFDDTSNNYKSAETADAAFLRTTLNPLLKSIETEFMRKLISPRLYGFRKFEFDRYALYSCDVSTRMAQMTQMLALGCTVNEIRTKMGYAPVAGGDEPLVSANLKNISELQ